MSRTIETELVPCVNTEGGILFGVRHTKGNPERFYIGLLSINGPSGYSVWVSDSDPKRFKSWYDVENFVNETVLTEIESGNLNY